MCFRSIEPQQQPVVEKAWVIDSVGIHNERPHQAAQFDEVMPVTAITRQAGGLDTEHRAYAAGTNLGHQPGKARTIDLTGAGTSKIFVDDLDLLETELAGVVGQSVLSPLAFQVVGHLNRR